MINKLNTSTNTVIVATSIVPKGIENQKAAIDTWIKAGFKVISFNSYEEWLAIKDNFDDIEIVVIDRDASLEFGKPYIYCNDILDYFKKCSYDICGIINSDIYLSNIDSSFLDFLSKEAIDSFIFGSRIDVHTLDNLNGTVLENGFDYFFFDKKISEIYDQEGFCLGQPVWDLWIIFMPIIKGITVKRLVSPIGYHLVHCCNWDKVTNDRFRKVLLEKYKMDLCKFSSKSYITPASDSIDFLELISDYAEEIIYMDRSNDLSILLVYDNGGISRENSPTYKSILEQIYKNYRIVNIHEEEIDVTQCTESLICLIKEGCILDKRFLYIMLTYIKEKDAVICNLQLTDDDMKNMKVINLFDICGSQVNANNITDECVIYKKSCYEKVHREYYRIANLNVAFLGMSLVKMKYHIFVERKIEKYAGKRILFYGAGGHTRTLLENVNFSRFHICGIVDRNRGLWGSEIFGHRIYSISEMDSIKFDYILISSMLYELEIYNELIGMLPEDKIVKIYND